MLIRVVNCSKKYRGIYIEKYKIKCLDSYLENSIKSKVCNINVNIEDKNTQNTSGITMTPKAGVITKLLFFRLSLVNASLTAWRSMISISSAQACNWVNLCRMFPMVQMFASRITFSKTKLTIRPFLTEMVNKNYPATFTQLQTLVIVIHVGFIILECLISYIFSLLLNFFCVTFDKKNNKILFSLPKKTCKLIATLT